MLYVTSPCPVCLQVLWFTEAHRPELRRHVFAPFPFSRLVGRRKKAASSAGGSSAPPADLGSDAINALVCELAAGLAAGEGTQQVRHSVLEYLTGEDGL